MTDLYEKLDIPSDLSLASFHVALGTRHILQLHIHPDLLECARAIAAMPETKLVKIHVVVDHRLDPREWYVMSAAGSCGP